ncbi:unnamed protein product [Linum trigynum]|uniref:Uncharacterized protein n=1 Tax=Linum trigynum TaxID=586398 RepID=A0AAV2FMJ7_9ROSI
MALLVHSPDMCTAKTLINPNPSPRNLKNPSSALRNDDRVVSSMARVRFGVKDREVKVPGLSHEDARLYGQFSAPVVKQGSKRSNEEEEEKQNYYVNMGHAIRTLREELPDLFYKELSFDIYRDDIVYIDRFNTFAGIENYKSMFWALRVLGRVFFRGLWVDIISVWQPVDDIILIRWVIHGIPRVPWESLARLDGISEYKLDKKGKIYQHQVDNMAFNSPPHKFRVMGMEELLQAIGCPSTPRPTYFEASSVSPTEELIKSG